MARLIDGLVFVGNYAPVFLDEGAKIPDSLQVGLIEAGEHEVTVVCLELCVEILQTVLLVGE